MHKKRVFFFSRDPGGANLLKEVYPCFDMEHKIYFAKDHSINVLKNAGIDHIQVDSNEDLWRERLNELKPGKDDLFITGTSNIDDSFEKAIWEYAQNLGITLAIFVDQPFRMDARFLNQKGELSNARPKWVFVPTMDCEQKIKSYFPGSEVISIGYPQVSMLYQNKIEGMDTQKDKLIQLLNLDKNKPIITFVSEPERGNSKPLYNEMEVFKEFVERLDQDEFNIVLKLHPKDSANHNYKYSIKSEMSSIEASAASDIIVGVKSIMLLEAQCLNKKIVSLDFLNSEDEMMFTACLGKKALARDWEEVIELIKNAEKSPLDSKIIQQFNAWNREAVNVLRSALN